MGEGQGEGLKRYKILGSNFSVFFFYQVMPYHSACSCFLSVSIQSLFPFLSVHLSGMQLPE